MTSRTLVPSVRILLPTVALGLALLAALASAPGCAAKHSAPAGGTTAPKELDSGNLVSTATYEHRFFNSGSFPYHCNFHSVMTGTVTVDAGAADTIADVVIVTNTVPFPAASIKPGGKVTWHNNSAMTHTVTSN